MNGNFKQSLNNLTIMQTGSSSANSKPNAWISVLWKETLLGQNTNIALPDLTELLPPGQTSQWEGPGLINGRSPWGCCMHWLLFYTNTTCHWTPGPSGRSTVPGYSLCPRCPTAAICHLCGWTSLSVCVCQMLSFHETGIWRLTLLVRGHLSSLEDAINIHNAVSKWFL